MRDECGTTKATGSRRDLGERLFGCGGATGSGKSLECGRSIDLGTNGGVFRGDHEQGQTRIVCTGITESEKETERESRDGIAVFLGTICVVECARMTIGEEKVEVDRMKRDR